jgi:long-chain acyl-CoA synthetase
LIKHREVQAIFNKEVKKYNQAFAHHEQIKSYELVTDEWSVNTGVLTPTLKVKRKAIQERYGNLIEKLFA